MIFAMWSGLWAIIFWVDIARAETRNVNEPTMSGNPVRGDTQVSVFRVNFFFGRPSGNEVCHQLGNGVSVAFQHFKLVGYPF